jgi:hypothetical protein
MIMSRHLAIFNPSVIVSIVDVNITSEAISPGPRPGIPNQNRSVPEGSNTTT